MQKPVPAFRSPNRVSLLLWQAEGPPCGPLACPPHLWRHVWQAAALGLWPQLCSAVSSGALPSLPPPGEAHCPLCKKAPDEHCLNLQGCCECTAVSDVSSGTSMVIASSSVSCLCCCVVFLHATCKTTAASRQRLEL